MSGADHSDALWFGQTGSTMMPASAVSTNGAAWLSLRSDFSSCHVASSTSSGTGENHSRLGQLNQRSAMRAYARGVHRLIAPMNISSTLASAHASERMRTSLVAWAKVAALLASAGTPRRTHWCTARLWGSLWGFQRLGTKT